MCGIAGIFAYNNNSPSVNRSELTRISDRMTERGPDGYGEWYSSNGRVGLAHRRLAIIDLSQTGAQPMTSSDGRFVITFNGEIYNYKELRIMLESRGYCFHSNSDTEVLLTMYQEKEHAMLQDLRGMYAFAIWDNKECSLFLARDPFGIKPLYYADNALSIRFASQVKALLAGGNIDTSPDPAGNVGYFTWGSVPEPYTLFKGIRCLPAGHSLHIDCNGTKILQHFCSIPQELTQAVEKSRTLSPNQVHEELREALLDTVRHHLIADVPIGVFLSSGLDSTTLAALTAEVAPGTLQTVTLGFKEFVGTDDDETPLAEKVAHHYHSHHHTTRVEKSDFQNSMTHLLDVMDQPSIDGVNSYFVCKAAKAAGFKVVLSGLGGDELFGSYPSFHQIPKLVRCIRPFSFLPGLGTGFRLISAPVIKHFTSPKYAGLLEFGGSFGGAYLLRKGMYMPWELPELLDGDMLRQGWRELQTVNRLEETANGIQDPHLTVSALEMSWYMRNQLLRDCDWASMAHSLEVRLPLVDLKLLRQIAPLLSGKRLISKIDMARTPSLPLPSAVLNRHKSGFSVPVHEWLMGNNKRVCKRGLRDWASIVYDSFNS